MLLEPDRRYVIGRDPFCDLPLGDTRVSWHHATIGFNGSYWGLEDPGSTNGTFAQGIRSWHVHLYPGAWVTLGNPHDGPRLDFAIPAGVPTVAVLPHDPAATAHEPAVPTATAARPWEGPPADVPPQLRGGRPSGRATGEGHRRTVHELSPGTGSLRIGRASDNDIVLADRRVSAHHAELRRLPDGGWEVADLGSHAGTHLNGRPVGVEPMGLQDRLTIGRSSFVLAGDALQHATDEGLAAFSAHRLTVGAKQKHGRRGRLNDVSFSVPCRTLTAIIGPSGSGKSTLMRALTGYHPADQGSVVYEGVDLYQDFAELRQRIGVVPQSEILHKELTVRKALAYAARLRFPRGTRRAERTRRIEQVLRDLRLDDRADHRIAQLSGGQRKRVSVALELLTKPSLLVLDEPTSGLDPGMDREVMQTLRGLADDGRTVLVVTHSVAELSMCDYLLVMAPGGSLAYFGPPGEALDYFGYSTWADVFQEFESHRDFDWAGRYRASAHYRLYCAGADTSTPTVPEASSLRLSPARPQRWSSQLSTLTRRYLSVIASDRGFMALSLFLPLVLGGVSTVIPDYGCGLTACPGWGRNDFAGLILMVVAFGACLSGSANSVRELIKERAIYERERAAGLSRSAYLMSKVLVLGVISLVQGVLISYVAFSVRKLPGTGLVLARQPAVEMATGVVLLGFVSMLVGLAISALVKTAEKTMPLLVMFAVVQIVFTGAIFRLNGRPVLEQVAWLMPARWGVAAAGDPVDLAHLSPFFSQTGVEAPLDALWAHSAPVFLLNCGVLLTFCVVLTLVILRLQRRHEPEIMRQG
nr:ATP-binding cassette domain-containing protein [Streptacidiphilus rugosus]